MDIVTRQYLINNPSHVFVFGDNTLRRGRGGAAALRDLPNTFGFITKRYPNNHDASFYRPSDYMHVFLSEMSRLHVEIFDNPENRYLISRIGAGLANRYNIWEEIILPRISRLSAPNVRFLF